MIRGSIFTQSVSNYAQSRKEAPFWGLHNGRKHLGGQIPQKPSKLGVNMLCRASQLRVNEDWRHIIGEWRHWRVAALQRKRCQLVFDDHCQTYGNYAKLLSKCQIIVPIHIDLNKLHSVHVFLHKSWNFCSYHIAISIFAMLDEIYLNLLAPP